MPRLTQVSSFGSRGNAGASRAGATSADTLVEDRSAGKRRRGGLFGRLGDKAQRDGFRGALGVVGVVGLLSAGVLGLILVLVNQDDGGQHGSASVVVDAGDYGADDVAGLDTPAPPSASASGTKEDGKADHREAGKSSASPSASASPSSGASGKDTKAPDKDPAAAAEDGPRTGASSAPAGVGIFSHDSQRCLDVVGGKAVSGTRLMIWDCSGSVSQHWTFPSDGTMRVLGMCVQLANGSTADGAVLQLAGCNGGPAQQFELNYRHDVVSKLADKCADVQDEGTANGTRIQLWTCNGHDNQKWSES